MNDFVLTTCTGPLLSIASILFTIAGYILLLICAVNLYYDHKSGKERFRVLKTKISVLTSENYKQKCIIEKVWFNGRQKLPDEGKTVLVRFHREDNPFEPYIYDTDICIMDMDGKRNWLKHKDIHAIDWTIIPQD